VRDARVGEHHVEASELGDHPIHEVPHLARVAHVHADGEGRPPPATISLATASAPATSTSPRAPSRPRPRTGGGRAPDAERAAGDRGDPSLQAHAAASILACLKTERPG